MSCQVQLSIQKTIRRICSKHPWKTLSSLELPKRNVSVKPLRSAGYGGLSRDSGNRLPPMNLKPLKRVCRPALMKDNESAQVAVILFFFLAVVFIGFYWMMLGPMMDTTTAIHNNLTQGAGAPIPLTQDRQDALGLMQTVFQSTPIIAFILTIIVAIIAGLASRYNVV